MGKIDKEKLLKEIRSLGYYEEIQIIKTIRNFPEEPEQPIDFDALRKECLDGSTDLSIACGINRFYKFLKSKNLTAPKQFEIPVNKIWKLKEKYVNYFESKGIDSTQFDNYTEEPECVELYDLHEEPDYSKIPKGSIVECVTKTAGTIHDKINRVTETQVWFNHYSNIAMSSIVSIRIVELAKE